MLSINKTDGYDALIVVGKNQLELEKNILASDPGDYTTMYLKNIEKPPEEHTKEIVFE